MMNVTVCTHPQRCAEMEAAHSSITEQLAAAQGKVQQLQAQLLQRDETLAAALADNNRLRMDVQMYVGMFDEATRKAVRE
jgi:adenylosuccinate lyase